MTFYSVIIKYVLKPDYNTINYAYVSSGATSYEKVFECLADAVKYIEDQIIKGKGSLDFTVKTLEVQKKSR